MIITGDVTWVLPCSRALSQDNRQLIVLAINLTHPASKSIALNLFYSAWPNSLSKSPPNVFWLSWSKIICVDNGHLYIFCNTAILPLTDKNNMLVMHWSTSSSLRGPESTLVAPLFKMPHFSGRAYICDMFKIIDD